MKRLTTDIVIERSKNVHGSKYDYSLSVYKDSMTKMKIICKEHGVFSQIPHAHMRGNGCPLCGDNSVGNKLKKGKKQFILEAKKKHGNKFLYNKVKYVNVDTKITLFCTICKIEFKCTPYSHLKGRGSCPKCKGVLSNEANKLSTQEFITKSNIVHGNLYDYSLVKYTGNQNKVAIICKKHGVFQQQPNNHMMGKGCIICSGTFKRTNKQFITEAKKVHGDLYDYSKVNYTNTSTNVIIICKIHGEFNQTPNGHLNNSGCPKCGVVKNTNKLTDTTTIFIEKANKTHNNKYDYSKVDYIKSLKKVKIVCKIHGEFDQVAGSHVSGLGCPFCTHQVSKAENEIKKWIESLDVKTKHATGFLKFPIRNQDIDILLPKYKIGIEYNGLFYHSTRTKEDKNYHLNKTIQAQKQGIHLMHFWDYEWKNSPNIIKSIIRNAIGKTKHKYFARKLNLKQVETQEARAFCICNHLNGFRAGSKYLGLYNNDELLSLMITSKTGEMLRFVNKINTNITGGFSKLLKYSNTKYSFVDRRVFTGNGYVKNGFILERVTPPNYFYVLSGSYAGSRQMFQKHKLKKKLNNFNPDLTEIQNMKNNGYYQVFDCGSYYMKKV